jgi:hypothetical protein
MQARLQAASFRFLLGQSQMLGSGAYERPASSGPTGYGSRASRAACRLSRGGRPRLVHLSVIGFDRGCNHEAVEDMDPLQVPIWLAVRVHPQYGPFGNAGSDEALPRPSRYSRWCWLGPDRPAGIHFSARFPAGRSKSPGPERSGRSRLSCPRGRRYSELSSARRLFVRKSASRCPGIAPNFTAQSRN